MIARVSVFNWIKKKDFFARKFDTILGMESADVIGLRGSFREGYFEAFCHHAIKCLFNEALFSH